MNQNQIKRLKDLAEKVEYSRGTSEFDKWAMTLLTWLDGALSGINLEPVEEVKVKAFVPEKGENFFFLDDGLEISSAREGYCSELFIQGNLKFRTKKDAQIAQAKVIELFNSFK